MSKYAVMPKDETPARMSYSDLRDALMGAGLAHGILEGRVAGSYDDAREKLKLAAHAMRQVWDDLGVEEEAAQRFRRLAAYMREKHVEDAL